MSAIIGGVYINIFSLIAEKFSLSVTLIYLEKSSTPK